MAASMESSGQTRATTLMNAARRSHFVARIEKYEAKARHAKALMKEQNDGLVVGQQKRNTVGQHVAMSKEQKEATVPDQMRPSFDHVEHQRSLLSESRALAPTEKVLMHLQVSAAINPKTVTCYDLSCRENNQDLSLKKGHEEDYSLVEQHHEKGYLSQEEAFCAHARCSSPDQKTQTHTEQKEIISGALQRSSSSNMMSIVKGIDRLDMNSGIPSMSEQVFPIGFVPSVLLDFNPHVAPEVNIDSISGALNIRIKAVDMSAPMQEHAFRCARECLDVVGKLQSKRIAYTLKKEFDNFYGPAWHCIVGASFGSYVTHSLGGFVYFSLDKVSVLLFKTTVEPIENS